jgi:hypothetical protein
MLLQIFWMHFGRKKARWQVRHEAKKNENILFQSMVIP